MPNHAAKTSPGIPARVLVLLLGALLSACDLCDEAAPLSSAYDGHWQDTDPSADYPAYLRISGGRGFHCVLDGKSSYFFEVRGSAINTPFNGRGELEMGGDGLLAITGEEKGEVYTDRYRRVAAADYPSACREQERTWQ